ncbi:MAG: hypothetical protein ABSH39_13305 [Candidatus Acidiferrum sp.]|jgi:hypothetical protein
MFNSKTHFEQVPLEFVKQIVEEQIRTVGAGETMEEIQKEMLNEGPPEAERRPILEPRTIAKVRSLN